MGGSEVGVRIRLEFGYVRKFFGVLREGGELAPSGGYDLKKFSRADVCPILEYRPLLMLVTRCGSDHS